MAKIVVVKNRLPYPPLSGTDVVTFHLLRALATRHDVTLVSLIIDERQRRHAGEFAACGVRLVPVMMPNKKSIAHRVAYKIAYWLAAALSGSPRDLWYYNPPALRRAVRDAARGAALVQFEYWFLYPTAAALRGVKKILLQHDAEFQINRRLVALSRSPLRKLGRWLRAVRRKGLEAAACRRFDEVLCLSPADAALLAPYTRRPPVVVFPIVPLPPREEVGRGFASGTLIYFGGTTRDVNRHGLEKFLREIFPAIARAVPDVKFKIIGEKPRGYVARRLRREPAVSWERPRADLAAAVAAAAVAVVPLWAGAGVKIKILTACSYGLPVVTTPVGAEGIPARPGEELLVAATAEEFAAAVITLLRDERRWRALSAGARAFAERETAPGRRNAEVAALYERLAAS